MASSMRAHWSSESDTSTAPTFSSVSVDGAGADDGDAGGEPFVVYQPAQETWAGDASTSSATARTSSRMFQAASAT